MYLKERHVLDLPLDFKSILFYFYIRKLITLGKGKLVVEVSVKAWSNRDAKS